MSERISPPIFSPTKEQLFSSAQEQLMNRLLTLPKGHTESLEPHEPSEIFWFNFQGMVRYAISAGLPRDKAEETVTDILGSTWKRAQLPNFSFHAGNPMHYLHTAIKNAVVDQIRTQVRDRKYHGKQVPFEYSYQAPNNHDDEDPLRAVLLKERNDEEVRFYHTLTPLQKQVYYLNRDGLKNREIAEKLSTTLGAVKGVLYRINKNRLEFLAKNG